MNHDCRPVVQQRLGEATRLEAAGRFRRASLPVLLALLSLVPLHASAADLLSLFQLAELAGGDFTFTSGGYSLNATQPLYHRDRQPLISK